MKIIFKGYISIGLMLLAACTAPRPNTQDESIAPEPEQAEYFLNSSEYKLLLNPSYFSDYEAGFAAYWDTIQRVAADLNITVRPSKAPLKIGHKKVSFLDTPDRALRKASVLIRRKVKMKNGERTPGFEYGLKFRDKDPRVALSKDLSLAEGFERKFEEIELESDIVYYSIANGDVETSYTVSNSIDLEADPSFTLSGFQVYFPFLNSLGLAPETPLSFVSGIEVDEYMVKMGHLEFGDGLEGRMDMSIWEMATPEGVIIVPEFSFDHSFLKEREYDSAAMERCVNFIRNLNKAAPEWTVPGELKAAALFNLPQ